MTFTTTITDVNETEKNGYFVDIYPNPAADDFTVLYNNEENSSNEMLFEVYELLGKKLISMKLKPNNSNRISTSGLKQGVYICKFIYKNSIVKKDKLVIINK